MIPDPIEMVQDIFHTLRPVVQAYEFKGLDDAKARSLPTEASIVNLS